MPELHLFIQSSMGGYDYIIATDVEDARAILVETIDMTDVDDADWEFEQWPDDQVFTITYTEEPGQPKESHLPAEWARLYGHGYLGGAV